jgi:hypothetical protein
MRLYIPYLLKIEVFADFLQRKWSSNYLQEILLIKELLTAKKLSKHNFLTTKENLNF